MRKYYILVYCFVFSINGFSQHTILKDKEVGVEFVKNLYYQSIGEYSPIYAGLQYINYDYNIIGHQYFLSDEPAKASIVFNGVNYKDLSLLYDVHLDQLVIIHDSTSLRTILIKEKVESFRVWDNQFINFHEAPDPEVSAGIYNLIYDGDNKVFVKRKKIIEEHVSDLQLIREFISQDIFIVNMHDKFHTIKRKSSLLKLFGDDRRRINRHLKEQDISFKKNKEAAIQTSISYYESL